MSSPFTGEDFIMIFKLWLRCSLVVTTSLFFISMGCERNIDNSNQIKPNELIKPTQQHEKQKEASLPTQHQENQKDDQKVIIEDAECFTKQSKENHSYQLCKMFVDNHERWFSYKTPTSRQDQQKSPVLFSFHGGGANFTKDEQGLIASDALNMIESWVSLVDIYSYIIVVPYGSLEEESGKGRWFWKDGDHRNDYLFIEVLLAWLEKKFSIDKSRVFGTGHSSGGIFLYSWLSGGPFKDPVYKTDPNFFRAFSASGANLNLGTVEASPQVLASVLHLNGENDDTQYWQVSDDVLSEKHRECSQCFIETIEGTTFLHDPSGYWYPVWNPETQSTVGNWSNALECESSYSQVKSSCFETYQFSQCRQGSTVEVRKLLGCGHPVKASRLRMDFFERFCSDKSRKPCTWGERCNSLNQCVTNSNWQQEQCSDLCSTGSKGKGTESKKDTNKTNRGRQACESDLDCQNMPNPGQCKLGCCKGYCQLKPYDDDGVAKCPFECSGACNVSLCKQR